MDIEAIQSVRSAQPGRRKWVGSGSLPPPRCVTGTALPRRMHHAVSSRRGIVTGFQNGCENGKSEPFIVQYSHTDSESLSESAGGASPPAWRWADGSQDRASGVPICLLRIATEAIRRTASLVKNFDGPLPRFPSCSVPDVPHRFVPRRQARHAIGQDCTDEAEEAARTNSVYSADSV